MSAASGRRSSFRAPGNGIGGPPRHFVADWLRATGIRGVLRFLSAAALVVALAIALGSCGGDDGGSSASRSVATGPTGAAQPPPSDSGSGSDSGADNGTGGASAPAGDKGNDSQAPTSGSKGSGKKQDNGGGGEQRASQDRTPTSLEELSPAQRRQLERSLYSQAKKLCSAYTVAQLKESYNIHANEMEDVARRFAELYEQAAPSLVLPYQQGCVAGLRERERKNRRAATDQGP